MDKILQSMSGSKNVTVTNDGATILHSIYVDNPAAKVLQDISKVQDDEVRTPLPARAACLYSYGVVGGDEGAHSS